MPRSGSPTEEHYRETGTLECLYTIRPSLSSVLEQADALRKTNRLNVHFLLCCRDIDWLHANANQLPGKYPAILFTRKRLRGLSLDDAKLIVDAWGTLGQRGLRDLALGEFD